MTCGLGREMATIWENRNWIKGGLWRVWCWRCHVWISFRM